MKRLYPKNPMSIIFTLILLLVVSIIISGFAIIINTNLKNLPRYITKTETRISNTEEIKPSYNYMKSSTVYIKGTTGKKSWIGTGFIVKIKKNYTYILTNAHVAGKTYDKKSTVYIEDNGRFKETELVTYHKTLDMAIIKVKGSLFRKKTVKGFTIAYPSDKVYLVGHHLGRKYVYGEGVFAGYQEFFDIIQIPVLFGNSGSAVFNQDGKVVGIIFAINRVGMGVDCAHGLAIDGLNIKIFLKENGIL